MLAPKKYIILGLSTTLFLSFIVGGYFLLSANKNKKPFMEFVYVKGGTFMMGAGTELIDIAEPIEMPAHKVKLSSYYIGKYPVTYAQFAVFVSETGYLTDAETGRKRHYSREHPPIVDTSYGSWIRVGSKRSHPDHINWRYDYQGELRDSTTADHPVIHLTFNDAVAFCKWLSEKEGKDYHLPSEAEWEFAARGGRKSHNYTYSGSDDADEVAWHLDNSGGVSHPVGQKKPNELGIYDMSGLVRQFTSDGAYLYTEESQVDPHYEVASYEESMASGFTRKQESICTRSSSVLTSSRKARVTSRSFHFTTQRGYAGFRVACSK